MPDILPIGLGGGSLIADEGAGGATVRRPQLVEEALVWWLNPDGNRYRSSQWFISVGQPARVQTLIERWWSGQRSAFTG